MTRRSIARRPSPTMAPAAALAPGIVIAQIDQTDPVMISRACQGLVSEWVVVSTELDENAAHTTPQTSPFRS